MKICIVGGGVSGIQTALYLFEKGHECHMYESRDKLGGVWVENYDGYSLQVPSQLYEFRSMKLEYLDGTFPSGQKVQEMIQTFINMKELQKKCHIHLNEKIVKIYKSEKKNLNYIYINVESFRPLKDNDYSKPAHSGVLFY